MHGVCAGALYARGDGPIKAALYLTRGAFSASSGYATDRFIQPAKPQTPADMHGSPLFAVNQGATVMVVAALQDTEALSSMTAAYNAPRLVAKTVPYGFRFTDGVYSNFSQPQSQYWLDGGDMDYRITAVSAHLRADSTGQQQFPANSWQHSCAGHHTLISQAPDAAGMTGSSCTTPVDPSLLLLAC